MVRVWKTKSLLFCLRDYLLIVFRRQNHVTFIFIKTMSHDLLVQVAYWFISRSSFDECGREMFKNACSTCSTIILVLLTNNITVFWHWRCRSCSRRRFLNAQIRSLQRWRLRLDNVTKQEYYWLLKKRKIFVLHVQHALQGIFMSYSTKQQREMTEFNVMTTTHTLFQNGRHFSILLFPCKKATWTLFVPPNFA